MVRKRDKEVEIELAKKLRGTVQPNSGAIPGYKGDIITDKFLISAKATDRQSISIQTQWLEEITQRALERSRTPVLALKFSRINKITPSEWIVVDLDTFRELIDKKGKSL